MKKIISAVLAVLLVFACCGCGVTIEKQDGHASEKYDLQEALSYLASFEPEKADLGDNDLLCPAQSADNLFYGYINTSGEWVIDPYYAETKEFEDGYASVLNNYSLYECINKDGRKVITGWDSRELTESHHFFDDMMIVSMYSYAPEKCIYVNKDFSAPFYAYDFPYVYGRYYESYYYFGMLTPYRDGKAVVMRLRNKDIADGCGPETAYVVDKAGKICATLPAGLDPSETGFDDNGNIIVNNMENRFGLCDGNGTLIVDCVYRFLRHCEGPLYLACNDNGFWGYIDEYGNTVIDFKYQKALAFSEGLAAVYDGKNWGFIDENGEEAIEFIFEDVASFGCQNIDYSAGKAAFCEGYTAVKVYGFWVVIDKTETPVAFLAEKDCEGISGSPFVGIKNGIISYAKNVDGKILYGAMTNEGRLLVEPAFSYLGLFN